MQGSEGYPLGPVIFSQLIAWLVICCLFYMLFFPQKTVDRILLLLRSVLVVNKNQLNSFHLIPEGECLDTFQQAQGKLYEPRIIKKMTPKYIIYIYRQSDFLISKYHIIPNKACMMLILFYGGEQAWDLVACFLPCFLIAWSCSRGSMRAIKGISLYNLIPMSSS